MVDRWVVGLAVLVLVCAGGALGLELGAASLWHEADAFYRSVTDAAGLSQQTTAYYDRIWSTAFGLQGVITPLVAGAVLAALTLCGVLALRWERRERVA